MTRTTSLFLLGLILCTSVILPSCQLRAQERLQLPELYRQAQLHDPRLVQNELQREATDLMIRNLGQIYYPQIQLGAEGSYQSEVPSFPISIPDVEVSSAPKEHIAASLNVQQLIYDGGVTGDERKSREAELAVEQSRLTATLYQLRAEIDEAFYSALLLQKQSEELGLTLQDLGARLGDAAAGVREGTRLPGDTATLRAEMLRLEQKIEELQSGRRALLSLLEELIGRRIDENVMLEPPDLNALRNQVTEIQTIIELNADGTNAESRERDTSSATAEAFGNHPQYALFKAEQLQLESRSDLVDRGQKPRVSAFGQLSVGRPGFEQFTSDIHPYWLAGVRLQWMPFDWGTSQRERQILAIRGEILKTEEDAFTARLRRRLRNDLEMVTRLESTLESDLEIIQLRLQIERQAERQLAERVITPAFYLDARTDLQDARLQREQHQIELVRAASRILTTIGIDPP